MAKKHQWKKAIRAEVAAALQQQPGSTSNPTRPAISSNQTRTVATAAGSGQMISPNQELVIGTDLRRIFWVALIMFALLAVATVTDRHSRWLDHVATIISQHVTK